MAITNGKIERLIETPTAGYAFTCNEASGGGDVVVTVTGAEKSFWSSVYTGTGGSGSTFVTDITDHLLDEMDDTFAVTIDATEGGTGKVTIANATGNFAITWTNTILRDLLGFSQGNLSGAATYTGASQAKGLYLPPAPMNSLFGAADKGFHEADGFATESPSGHVKAFFGNKKQVNQIMWNGVTHARTRASAESVGNESFEQFWLDSILAEQEWATSPGGVLRFYWSADNNSSHADYRAVGSMLQGFNPEKLEDGWLGLWRVNFDRLVLVP
jgi:hypothetical protein